MFEIVEDSHQSAVIKVIGVGGGGGNAVRHMVESDIEGVEFIGANTDAQALADMGASTTVQLGASITKGLGAGANPEVGRQSALEDRQKIAEALKGADMVFITAGMGGGTGTGAAPIVAEVAKELGILTVAVVTTPFKFEGNKRLQVAGAGLANLEDVVDSLITIPNENLLAVMGKKISLLDAFAKANDVLLGAVQGISDLITRSGIINVDFADVKTVMSVMGTAMMGTGRARGDNRALEAAEAALQSPLLDNVKLEGAKGILVNITAGKDMSLGEFTEVGDVVREFASDSATVVVGTVIDESMGEDLKVTVVATGLNDKQRPERPIEQTTEQQEAAPVAQDPAEEVSEPEKAEDEKDYSALDRPAISRRQAERRNIPVPEPRPKEEDYEYLEIPAFLRRQAT